VTDASLNRHGLAWDDLSIPEVGLVDAAEEDGGWDRAGWVRLGNVLPQRFWVHVVTQDASGTQVSRLPLDQSNQGTFVVRGLGSAVRRAWVVVAAGAERTTESASYTLEVRRAE